MSEAIATDEHSVLRALKKSMRLRVSCSGKGFSGGDFGCCSGCGIMELSEFNKTSLDVPIFFHPHHHYALQLA